MWSKDMAAVMAVMALAASFAMPAFASSSDVELEAVLTDSVGTEFGDAEFRAADDGRMRLEVDVSDLDDLGFIDGTIFEVFVAGESVGIVALENGGFDIDIDTDDGNMVPHVMEGDMIDVSYLGATVLSGTFMPEELEEMEIEED